VKLRTLTLASLLLTLAGLALIASLGYWTWRGVATGLEDVRALSELRRHTRALGTALDYLILVRSDPAVIRDLHDEAARLAQTLADDDHPHARDASRRLHEIAALMQILEQRRPSPAAADDAATLGSAVQAVRAELRAHEAEVQGAMDGLLDDHHEEVVRALLRGLGLFLAASLAFAALAALVAWRVRRRLGAPLDALRRGLREFSAGNLDARIDLPEEDELGTLAAAFNDMAEHRRESELLLGATIASSPMPIVSVDAQGRVLSWNDAAERVFGWSAAEAVGEPMPIVAGSAMHEQFAALRARVLAGEVITGHEIVRRNRDGEPITLLLHAAPLFDVRQRAFGIVAIFEDVTTAREQERRLRLQAGALEAAANGIVITDREGVIQWVNPAFCAASGYRFEEAVGRRPGELLGSGEHDETFYARLWRTIEAGEVWRGEVTNRCKDGSRIIEEMSITPIRAEGDAITHFVAVKQDITERKEAERRILEQARAIAEREERLRYVARASVDTIRDWDLRADRMWWNDGLHTQYGYAAQDIEPDARSWSARLHPDEADALRAELEQVLASERETWEAHYRFRRADGSYARVVDRSFVIRDPHGQAARMVSGMTDITRQLELEEQLQRAHHLEAVGQLTGGVAHDFNNLLTVIQGNAELLAEGLEGHADKHALASTITTAARRGADLTRRLLAFARKQALEPRVVDVNAMLSDTRELLARTLGEQVETTLLLAPQVWPALVDPSQLESALVNLCLNARDAMPGGGRLSIETRNVVLDEDYAARAEVEPGEYVLVAVSDTGEGIDPAVLPRVFEPFFSTKSSKGTGLGLAMVYGFLKQSAGHINIYSEPGQGTTVRMYLPRARDAVAPAAPAAIQPEGHAGAGESILLVEDDDLVRGYVASQLESLGYRVLEAENGPQALERLHAGEDVDLLFTDVVMPGGMNGRELADAARALRPALRVLFTSGYTENAIVHHGTLDPGVELLSKPYRRSELAARIRTSLKG